MKILDGTGGGYLAKVDQHNRLATDSLTVDEALNATFEGMSYNVNSGDITLTSANESGVVYVSNTNSSVDIVVDTLILIMGASTGGSGDLKVDVKRNPTAGTLISSGTAFDSVNRDFGSANTLGATILKGAEGSTVTDGDDAFKTIITAQNRTVAPVNYVLRPGNSIAITITPPTGNTSMTIQAGFSCYERD